MLLVEVLHLIQLLISFAQNHSKMTKIVTTVAALLLMGSVAFAQDAKTEKKETKKTTKTETKTDGKKETKKTETKKTETKTETKKK